MATSRNSRRGNERPPKKAVPYKRGRPRNLYRRKGQGEGRGFWRRAVFASFWMVFLGGLGLALLLLYHQLLTSPWFCIKENNSIEIVGAKRLSPELIRELGGLGPGLNLLRLSPGQVEKALLVHPWIAEAEVTRKWPSRLKVRIEEREPAALVQMGEELYYVDRRGGLFKPLSPGDPHSYPIITGLSPEQFPPGGPMPEALTKAMQLLDLLKEAAPPLNLSNVSEVHVDLERGFSLYANGLGCAVEMGLGDAAINLKKFAQIWPVLSQKGYLARTTRINLDNPQRALISLKGEEKDNQ